jgi:hypothetical protein
MSLNCFKGFRLETTGKDYKALFGSYSGNFFSKPVSQTRHHDCEFYRYFSGMVRSDIVLPENQRPRDSQTGSAEGLMA